MKFLPLTFSISYITHTHTHTRYRKAFECVHCNSNNQNFYKKTAMCSKHFALMTFTTTLESRLVLLLLSLSLCYRLWLRDSGSPTVKKPEWEKGNVHHKDFQVWLNCTRHYGVVCRTCHGLPFTAAHLHPIIEFD